MKKGQQQLTEEAPGEKPPRSRVRRVICVLALVLALAAGAVLWHVAGTIRTVSQAAERGPPGYAEAVRRLGGPRRSIMRLDLYLRLPGFIASHKNDAAMILARCGVEAVPVLAGALQRGELSGAVGLSLTGQKGTIELLGALRHKDARVRKAAAKSLGDMAERGIGGAEVSRELAALLRDADGQVRMSASGALFMAGTISDESVLEVVRHLNDQNALVRINCAAAVLKHSQNRSHRAQATREFAQLMIHSSVRVRVCSLLTLKLLGKKSESLAPVLVEVMASPRTGFTARSDIAEVLASIERVPPEAVPHLEKMLRSRYSACRFWAAKALGNAGAAAKGSIPLLRSLLSDPEPGLPEAATEALKKIKAAQQEQKR
jgi:HEAT repeat